MNSRLPLPFIALLVIFALSLPCQAREQTLEQDTDKDGKVDRIIRFGKDGKIATMEIDSNGDGVMDRLRNTTRTSRW